MCKSQFKLLSCKVTPLLFALFLYHFPYNLHNVKVEWDAVNELTVVIRADVKPDDVECTFVDRHSPLDVFVMHYSAF